MPIYLYRCGSCNCTAEALQRMGDAPLLECPECGAQALKKIMAPVGVIFKGTGFHKNDYTTSKAGPARTETGADKGATEAASGTPKTDPAAPGPAAPGANSTPTGQDSSSTSNKDSGASNNSGASSGKDKDSSSKDKVA